jgi:hypothetical protein
LRRAIAIAVIINLQFLQLESNGSQLSGAKNRIFLSHPGQILFHREHEKVLKNQKRPAHCNALLKKSTGFCKYLKNRL